MLDLQINPKEIEKTLLKIEQNIVALDEQKQYKIMLICEEILTNIIRHADFQDKTPQITITIKSSKQNITTFTCKDNSKEFNLLKHPDPVINEDIDKRKLGGLGIYLSKKYAKTLEYNYEDGFNVLKITL